MPKRLSRMSPARVVLLITAVIALYFLVTAGLNAVRAHQLRQEQDRLQEDVQDLRARYQRLQALKQYLNSDEYIESTARNELVLVHKGETGFIAISTVPSPTPAPGQEQPALWWDALIR